MKVTVLGNNSALPAFGRYPTSQIVQVHEHLFLVDCGEGAQMRMQQFGIRSDRINHVFISHLHGDHYFGLVGFISSLSLKGRTRDLFLYCDASLKAIIDLQLPWDLGFKINYHFLKEGDAELLLKTDTLEVKSFPVYHSVPTHGFLFTEKKRKRRLLPDKLRQYEIPKYYYKKLSEGFDYTKQDGSIIKNEWVSEAGSPDKKYAFAADTRFAPEIVEHIFQADLLYHETTYLHDLIDKAAQRMHSTTLQAAEIARAAQVKKLLIGHFSSKYKNLEPFIAEVQTIFMSVELATEGSTFEC